MAIDAHRTGSLALMTLLLLAVVSPACLAAASPAVAAPMESPHSQDPCHPPSGDVDACPHHEQMQSDAVVRTGALATATPAALAPSPMAEPEVDDSPVTCVHFTGRAGPSPPPSPLRL